MGTAASSQVVSEALGMALTHAALSPSGHPIWLDMARRSARAVMALEQSGFTMKDLLSEASIHNAMVTHAACGGSTNLVLHLTAIAHAAGLRRPTVEDWTRINRQIPRLVDVLPNGPTGHATVQVFLAGGVPEVMLHLRRAGLLELDARTVSGENLGTMLDWWEDSERRTALRAQLTALDGIDPDNVIMSPDKAKSRGLTSTVCFPKGNLTPDGSVIKSTAIDPTVVDDDGVYRNVGPARVFLTEKDAIAAVKSTGPERVKAGDIIVLICRGPMGSGMEEAFQLTIALRHLSFGKHIALLTDARFSGVSTGACIGHISPEALAGGPIGKVREGDMIEIVIDRNKLEGSINLVGENGVVAGSEEGNRILAARSLRGDLAPDPLLPPETKLWAALQDACGGTWGGCVFDADMIVETLAAGRKALERDKQV
jgi:putative YjhG/YagF family dehydratase